MTASTLGRTADLVNMIVRYPLPEQPPVQDGVDQSIDMGEYSLVFSGVPTRADIKAALSLEVDRTLIGQELADEIFDIIDNTMAVDGQLFQNVTSVEEDAPVDPENVWSVVYEGQQLEFHRQILHSVA